MQINNDTIRKTIDELMPAAMEFLRTSIGFPSTPGNEQELVCWVEKQFEQLGVEVRRAPLSETLRTDEDYSSPLAGIRYDGRFNLRLRLPGNGTGRKLLLNSHVDVVPASPGQACAWKAVERDGAVYGRGACDAKGQVATIYLVLAALKKFNVPLAGDLIVHLVNEEENGGNGTLAMIRRGEEADGCIVLEPTGGRICTSVRGAVWFRAVCEGRAGHSGGSDGAVGALAIARKTMDLLEQYHHELLAASRGMALFDRYENPMPINFGRCSAGDWPATVPSHAIVEGVLGFLPNRTCRQVMDEIRAALTQCGEPVKSRVRMEFPYRHDSHVCELQQPLVVEMQACLRRWNLPDEAEAMVASCDSWYYHNQLGIPTIVFGPGSLADAHGRDEHIAVGEVATAGCVLTECAVKWCGEAVAVAEAQSS